ncbi:hypothetical protein FACS1894132_00620 [Clostridia bacterium]|nr:hypothetical protein FACS1894132_00620 [Clostridia bacterium]
MKKIISILLICTLLFSTACIDKKSNGNSGESTIKSDGINITSDGETTTSNGEDTSDKNYTKLNIDDFSFENLEQSNLKFLKINAKKFPFDVEFLKSENLPQDIIDDHLTMSTGTIIVPTENEVFYFILDSSPMGQFGTKRYRIVSVDNKTGEEKQLFMSDTEHKRDIYSAVIFNGELFWSEAQYYDTYEDIRWKINKIKLNGEATEIDNGATSISLATKETSQSFLIPVLSANDKGVYWIETHSAIETADAKFDIVCYNTEKRTVVRDIVCNSPYARIQVSANNFLYLKKNEKDNTGIIVNTNGEEFETGVDCKLISAYDWNDKYIIFEKLPEPSYYVRQELYIYDRATKITKILPYSPYNVSSVGLIGNYIYMNIAYLNGKENPERLGFSLLDLKNSTIFSISNSQNFVHKSYNGSVSKNKNGDFYYRTDTEIVMVNP